MKILLYIGDKNLKKKTKKLITGFNCRIICKLYYDNYSGPQFLFLIIIVLEIFSSEVDDIFYFVFRKIFFLIRLYFNHDDGKNLKKKRNSGLFCGKVIEYFREYDACLYCVLKNTNTLNLHEPYFFL